MLKRSSLTKQFDEIVRAEMANHNEAICQSNLALKSVKEDLLAMEKRLQVKIDKVSNDINKEIISLKRDKENLEKEIEWVRRGLATLKDEILRIRREDKASTSLLISDFVTNGRLKEDYESILAKAGMERAKIEASIESVTKTADKMFLSLVDTSRQLSESLAALDEKTEKRLNDTGETIETNKVDREGVTREIAILKKTLYINEKKIEDLYTLINRLKDNTK